MRSKPTQGGFAEGAIDVENGIIPDVVMVQEGPAKGHGVHLEAEFVEKIQKYDQKHFGVRGLKARFGHPSASGETMGTQLGTFRNFRTRTVDGKLQAIADLHLLEAADESPTHPGMRSWVLKMAAEQPDFIMSSIVFSVKGYYQRNPNGNKHNLIISTEYYGDPFTNYKEEWGNIFVEFEDHHYTDLVEAGAATDALFSNEANPHFFVSQFLSFIEEHPELKSFAQKHPEKVFDLLKALGVNPNPKTTQKMTLLEKLFGKKEITEDVVMSSDEIQELRTKMGEAETLLSDITLKLSEATVEIESLKASLGTKTAELTTALEKIAELEKLPAGEHTRGNRGDEGEGDDAEKAFHKDPTTAKAMAAFNARQKNKKAA